MSLGVCQLVPVDFSTLNAYIVFVLPCQLVLVDAGRIESSVMTRLRGKGRARVRVALSTGLKGRMSVKGVSSVSNVSIVRIVRQMRMIESVSIVKSESKVSPELSVKVTV